MTISLLHIMVSKKSMTLGLLIRFKSMYYALGDQDHKLYFSHCLPN